MQQAIQTESSRQIEITDVSLALPAGKKSLPQARPALSGWKCHWKRYVLLAILVIFPVLLGLSFHIRGESRITATQTLTSPQDLTFMVHCPISYFNGKNNVGPQPESFLSSQFYQTLSTYSSVILPPAASSQNNYNPNRTYLVEAKSALINGVTQLSYCGLVRDFYGTCDQAIGACSSPGPIFDIPARQSIDVIWVNNIDPSSAPNNTGTCLDASMSKDPFCALMSKINRTQTYADPTRMTVPTSFDHTHISPTTWPFNTHVHGAEVRPIFDGNPLSWIDNSASGKVGVGTLSLNESCYFDAFDSIDSQKNSYNPPNISVLNAITGNKTQNYKISRYPNQQNPGSLWYHDHSMHLTRFNVLSGLNGFYLLRDPVVQQQIGVDISNEKLVMLANLDLVPSFPLSGFLPDVVYRFRFLNNNFDDNLGTVMKIFFSYNNCVNDNLSTTEEFSIIGADSSLFHQSIDNQRSFVITQAERMEILIKFSSGQSQFAICVDNNINSNTPFLASTAKSTPLGYKLYHNIPVQIDSTLLKSTTLNKNSRTDVNNVSLSVAYTNLSLVTDIAVIRMRPLIFFQNINVFTIHGRTDFHSGWSQNPVLGTVEDWFIINTIFFPHPIHVHLINFQVIKEYDLRVLTTPIKKQCSLYEMDFVLTAMNINTNNEIKIYKANTNVGGNTNYNYLCDNLQAIKALPSMIKALSIIFPETQSDPITGISGLNVLAAITKTQLDSFKNYDISPQFDPAQPVIYKYVNDSGHPSAKPYYARWKDTAYVETFKVLQYRIRWTKSNYTSADKAAGTYFHVPNDQLREFPGYVYHCHILDHEDNEMMRPIMLQLPPNAKLNTSTPCNYNATSRKPVLKWADKYNCINKRCGNKPT